MSRRGNLCRVVYLASVEQVERRLLFSTFTVNTLSDATDPGPGLITLRQAVADTNAHIGADTIDFASSISKTTFQDTLGLTQGAISFTDTSGETTISGTPSDKFDINGSQLSRVFQISTGVSVSLIDLSITDGAVLSTPGLVVSGGGIQNAGTLTLSNVTVSGDVASDTGGGAVAEGGGIYNTGQLSITNSTISGNHAAGGSRQNAYGGGIYSTNAVTISGSVISNNNATAGVGTASDGANGASGEGGGIFAAGVTVVVGTTFTSNDAVGSTGDLGTTTAGYSGAGQGGAIFSSAALSVVDSTLVNNIAIGGDPAMHPGYENLAGEADGGAIYSSGSTQLSDDTVTENGVVTASTTNGGGVDIASGLTTINNSIITLNDRIDTGQDIAGTASSSSGYDLVGAGGGFENGVNGNLVTQADPKLGSLQNNGGGTITVLPADYSIVVDAGSNALVPAGQTSDQRGDDRISNGTVDMGAVEVQITPSTIVRDTPGTQSVRVGHGQLIDLGSFTQQDQEAPYIVTVNWDDGSANTTLTLSAAGDIPSLKHTFNDAGADEVMVTVTDADGNTTGAIPFDVAVNGKPNPVVMVSSSATLVPAGAALTFTAKVTGTYETPTGSVYFESDGLPIGSAVLENGVAILSTNTLSGAQALITAGYSGDSNYLSAASSSVDVEFYKASTIKSALSAKAKLPSTVIAGQQITSPALIQLSNPGAYIGGKFTFEFYLSSTPVFNYTGNANAIVAQRFSAKYNGTLTRAVSLKSLSTDLPVGNYYLFTKIEDPDALISVVAGSQAITVVAPYIQLAASLGGVKPAGISIKRGASLVVTITNDGNIAANGVLSIIVIPLANGSTLPLALAMYHANSAIKSGGIKRVTVHLKVPADLVAGSYFPALAISIGSNSVNVVGSTEFNVT